jgi:hypothetical protein
MDGIINLKNNRMGYRKISNPDRRAEEKRRERVAKVRLRIAEVEAWLMSSTSSHPEWDKRVREYNALNAKFDQVSGAKSDCKFEATPYRIINIK